MTYVRNFYGRHGIFDLITTDLLNYWNIKRNSKLNITFLDSLKTTPYLFFNNSSFLFHVTLYK